MQFVTSLSQGIEGRRQRKEKGAGMEADLRPAVLAMRLAGPF